MRLWPCGGRVLNSGVSFINTFSFKKIHIKELTEEFHGIGFAPPPLHGPGCLSRWVLPLLHACLCVCLCSPSKSWATFFSVGVSRLMKIISACEISTWHMYSSYWANRSSTGFCVLKCIPGFFSSPHMMGFSHSCERFYQLRKQLPLPEPMLIIVCSGKNIAVASHNK